MPPTPVTGRPIPNSDTPATGLDYGTGFVIVPGQKSQPGMSPGAIPPAGYGNQVTTPTVHQPPPPHVAAQQQAQRRPLSSYGAGVGNYYTPPGWQPPVQAAQQPGQGRGAKPAQRSGAPAPTPGFSVQPPSPQQPQQPGSVVGTETGTKVVGSDGTNMDFNTDPVTGAVVPHPGGMNEQEFTRALTPSHRADTDDVLTTLPGPVGDQFRILDQRRNALMSPQATQNLTPKQRQQQLESVNRQFDALRYSTLMESHGLWTARARQARSAEEQRSMLQAQNIKAQEDAAKEQQRQQAEMWKQAWDRAEANPAAKYRQRSQAEIAAEAQQHYAEMVNGPVPPQPGPPAPDHSAVHVSMGDPLDYRRRPDGGWIAVDENGRQWDAMVVNGVVVAAPASDADADALPPGAQMVTFKDNVPQVQAGPKPREQKPLPLDEEVTVKVREAAEAAAQKRDGDWEKYQAALADHKAKMDVYEEKAKADPTYRTTHVQPREPAKPQTVRELEEWWSGTQAGQSGEPLDYGAVHPMDESEARRRYWAKQGMATVEVPFRRSVERLRELPRMVLDGRPAVQVGDTVVPAQPMEYRGKRSVVPVPETAEQAMAVVWHRVPFMSSDSVAPKTMDPDLAMREIGERTPAAVARWVVSNFPSLPRTEQMVATERLLSGLPK